MHYGTTAIFTVLGHNPEMSDLSNPSGALYGDMFCAQVETPEGKIYDYQYAYHDEVEAEADSAFLASIEANPEGSPSFHFNRVAYGSEYHGKNREETEVSMMNDEERSAYFSTH